MPVISRPGEPLNQQPDSVLANAYAHSDGAVAARFAAVVSELADFAATDFTQPVLGFDAARYDPLRRDARQAMTELHRSLERWRNGGAL